MKYDKDQIRECFQKYKSAILTRNGEQGVKCVDTATLTYYSVILQKTINFDSIQIERELPIDKLTILKIRQSFLKDSIIHMNNKSLLMSLIDKGKAGNLNIGDFNLGEIKITGNKASVEKIINGKPTPMIYIFYNEEGLWKLSMFSQREHEIYNFGLKYDISISKLSEDKYILNFIETTSGVKIKTDIWQPLNR